MTRLKKMLVAGLVAIVTLCVSIGSAIVNVSQSIFSYFKASASSNYNYKNTNNTEGELDGDIITLSVPTRATLNESIDIPRTVATIDTNGVSTSATIQQTIVEIKNPYGDDLVYLEDVYDNSEPAVKIHDAGDSKSTQVNDDDASKYVLTPNQTGVYTVQYAVKNAANVWTLSEIFEITVTAESYSLVMSENNPIIMPTKIDTRENVSTDITLALPILYDENGEQISEFVLGSVEGEYSYVAEYKTLSNVWLNDNNSPVLNSETVCPQGTNLYENYSTYVVKKVLTSEVIDINNDNYVAHGLMVEIAVPGKTTKTNSSLISTDANLLNLTLSNFDSKTEVNYIDCAYSFKAGSGKNVITYKIYDNTLNTSLSPSTYLNYVINGNTANDSSKIDLGASSTKTIKYSDTSLKTKTYLPEVSATDKNNNGNTLNAYYYYSVYFYDKDTDTKYYDENKVVMGKDEGGLYFIPQEKGTYYIEYNAVDFYGHTDTTIGNRDYSVSVTDRTAPTLEIVTSYDPEDLSGKQDYTHALVTKVYTSSDKDDLTKWTKIAIPAIYTSDNVDSFDNLKITRTITSSDFIDKNGDKLSSSLTINIQNQNGGTDFDVEENTSKKLNKIEDVVTFDEVAKGVYTNFYIQKDADQNIKFYNNNDEELTTSTSELKKALIQAKTSQVAYVTLNPNLFGEGTYTVSLSVTDTSSQTNKTGKTINSVETPSFTFEVVYADSVDDLEAEAPTVKFSETLGSVGDNDTVTISKPEIKDDIDQNLYVKYYVVAGGKYIPLTLNEDSLTFKMSDNYEFSSVTKSIYEWALSNENIKVVAYAFNDYALMDGNNFAKYDLDSFDPSDYDANPTNYKYVGYGEYKISLKNMADTIAPVITNRTDAVVEYTYNTSTEISTLNQFGTASVNGIVFYDNTATDRISIKVLDSEGNSVAYEEIATDDCVTKIEEISKIKIADKTAKDIEMEGLDYKFKYTLAGISFTANKADNYTINYTITDYGNNGKVNSVSYSFVLVNVNDKQAPNISGNIGVNSTIELGDSWNALQNLEVTDNTTQSDEIRYEVTCKDENNKNVSSWFNNITMEFLPKAEGTYTITVKALDENNNGSTKSYTVKVSDTQKPVIKLINDDTSVIEIDESEITKDTNNKDVFSAVSLPGFTITDYNQGKNIAFNNVFGTNGKITITTPDNETYEISHDGVVEDEDNNKLNVARVLDGNNYIFTFTPTSRGHYTVVYSAEDLNGNSADSKTIDVYIGDTEEPVVMLNSRLLETLSKGFVIGKDEPLSIAKTILFDNISDLKNSKTNGDIIVTDNFGFKNKGDGQEGSNIYTTAEISLVDSNGNAEGFTSTTNTNDDGVESVVYTFTTAGTYKISIKVYDGVNNSTIHVETFTVTAQTSEDEGEKTNILGIILIVVSVLILAGVVIYFVKGTKLLPKRKNKVKKVDSEKIENKTED